MVYSRESCVRWGSEVTDRTVMSSTYLRHQTASKFPFTCWGKCYELGRQQTVTRCLIQSQWNRNKIKTRAINSSLSGLFKINWAPLVFVSRKKRIRTDNREDRQDTYNLINYSHKYASEYLTNVIFRSGNTWWDSCRFFVYLFKSVSSKLLIWKWNKNKWIPSVL